MRRAPAPEAELETEALKGEGITIYDISPDGWAWGQLAGDGYVGYVPAGALRAPGPPATHKVTAPRTLVYPGPSIKLPPTETLSFGCRLVIARMDEPFAITAAGGHVPMVHLAPVERMETDFVAVAERFLGTPYLWGGKTSLGMDCSGLVQLALGACGTVCPRDTDMQERALGSALAPPHEPGQWRRGDLLFWKGHVAIVRDQATLVHANAGSMAVALEAIAPGIPRIRAIVGEITSVRRLSQCCRPKGIGGTCGSKMHMAALAQAAPCPETVRGRPCSSRRPVRCRLGRSARCLQAIARIRPHRCVVSPAPAGRFWGSP